MESYTETVINKVKHYSKQVSCLSVLLALTACGSSGGGSEQKPSQASQSSVMSSMESTASVSSSLSTSAQSSSSGPRVASRPVFELPSEITVTENTPFRFQVSAKGDGTIRYQLLETPDAQYFELDEATGLLTAKQNFDFESPVDAGQNGTFNLSVNALSSFNLLTTADITIQLENIKEHIAQVEFPPEGANIGGFAETFTVRGIATKLNGDPITDNSITAITVNGVGAEFLPDAPAQWFAEVPVNAGENVFTIEAKDSDTMIKTAQRKVVNNPVQNSLINRAYTADGKYAYALDAGEQGIVKIDINGRSEKALFSLSSLRSNDPAETCTGFRDPELSANEKTLFLRCFTKAGTTAFVAYDLDNKNLNFITLDVGFVSVSPMHYSERYDIFSLPSSFRGGSDLRLYVFDNETGKAVPVFVDNVEDAITAGQAFLHNGFIQMGKDYRVLAKDVVDLAVSELSSDNTLFESLSIVVEDNAIAISPDLYNGAFLSGHYYDSNSEGVLFQYDAAGELIQSFDIPFPESVPSSLRGSRLKAFGSDQLIIFNYAERRAFLFNASTPEFLEIPRDASDPRFQRFLTKETSLNLPFSVSFEALKREELVYFSYVGRKLQWFSKSTHDITKSINLNYSLDELADTFVVAALSEAKEKLFISSRTNGFVGRDLEFNERDPLVVSFNYDEQSSGFKTLLTDAQLIEMLSHEKDQYFYEVTGLRYDSQRQKLYSAVLIDRNYFNDASVDYSDADSLYMLEYDDVLQEWRIHAHISSDSTRIANISPNWVSDALILEPVSNDSDSILCQDYCAETLTLADGLAERFSGGLWLNKKEKLLHLDSKSDFSQIGTRLLESSLDPSNPKVISDILSDSGPTFYFRYHYDSELDALFSNVDDFIVMVDTLTGDRVFVAKNEGDTIGSSSSNEISSISSTASEQSNSSISSSEQGSLNSGAQSSASSNSSQPSGEIILPEVPTFESDIAYRFEENSTIKIALKSNSNDATFQLANTLDARFFSIDTNTNEIKAIKLFNYESPDDADGDNIFDLIVNIVSASGAFSTQALSVEIDDIEEHQVQVMFPLEGGQLGGLVESLTVYGDIAAIGKVSTTGEFAVKVNGVDAVMTPDNSIQWKATIPIEQRINDLEIVLYQNGQALHTSLLTVDNAPIRTSNEIKIPSGGVYGIDLTAKVLYHLDSQDNSSYINILQFPELGCFRLSDITYEQEIDQVFALCSVEGKITNNLIGVDMLSFTPFFIAEDLSFQVNDFSSVAFSNELGAFIAPYSAELSFSYPSLRTYSLLGEINTFSLMSEPVDPADNVFGIDIDGNIKRGIHLYDGNLFVRPNYPRQYGVVDVEELLQHGSDILVRRLESDVASNGSLIIYKNYQYSYTGNNEIIRTELFGGEETLISGPDKGTGPIMRPHLQGGSAFLSVDDDFIDLFNYVDSKKYRIDIATGNRTVTDTDPLDTSLWRSMSQSEQAPGKLSLLSPVNKKAFDIGLSELSIQKRFDFSSAVGLEPNFFSAYSNDSNNNKFYFSVLDKYSLATIDLNQEVLVQIDTDTQDSEVLLSISDLDELLGEPEGARYRLHDIFHASSDDSVYVFFTWTDVDNVATDIVIKYLLQENIPELFFTSAPDARFFSGEMNIDDYGLVDQGSFLSTIDSGDVWRLNQQAELSRLTSFDGKYIGLEKLNALEFDGKTAFFIAYPEQADREGALDRQNSDIVAVDLLTGDYKVIDDDFMIIDRENPLPHNINSRVYDAKAGWFYSFLAGSSVPSVLVSEPIFGQELLMPVGYKSNQIN